MKSLFKGLLPSLRSTNNFRATIKSAAALNYQSLQPRQLLAGDVLVGDLNAGIAISDDASGSGFFLYSAQDVHQRFEGIVPENADHLIATRLDGGQWQFNDDTNWVDFEPAFTDRILADVNFDSNRVSRSFRSSTGGVLHSEDNGDLYFVADQFGANQDIGEFRVLGTMFTQDDLSPELIESDRFQSDLRLESLSNAAFIYESEFGRFPNLAIYDDAGTPLLSWRVQLLPYLGYTDLYERFNLDEAWNSSTNLSLLGEMPDVFASPYLDSITHTNYLALAGDNTITPLVSEPLTFSDVDNGTALYVEANENRSSEWSRPRDLVFNPDNPFSGLGDISPEGFSFTGTDGQTLTVDNSFPEDAWNGIVDRDDGFVLTADLLEDNFDTEDDLQQLGRAVLNYESAFQTLPASAIYSDTGEALLSWRVSVLPFLGYQKLYDQFNLDESWDSPNNLSLLPMMPQIYAVDGIDNGFTTYLAPTGSGTAFAFIAGINLGRVLDGTGDSILIVEADDDRAVQWTRPVDLPLDAANPRSGLGNSDDGGFHAVTIAGETIFVEDSVSDLDVASLLQIADGRTISQDVFPARTVAENLQRIVIASLNFESANFSLPTQAITADDGTPLLSWRVAILPFLDQNNLYEQFNLDEPWDSPNNIALLPLMPRIYAVDGIENGMTTILGIAGDEGLLNQDNQLISQIADGAGNTVLHVQADDDQATEWTKPQDIDFDPANPTSGVGNATASGFYTAFADGRVHFIPNTTDDETIDRVFQRADGEVFDPSFMLNQRQQTLNFRDA